MVADTFKEQRALLVREMRPWLEIFDLDLAESEVPLPQRPLRSLLMLFRLGALEIKAGHQKLDLSAPASHARADWFRVLFDAVRTWYVDRYGLAAMRGRGTAPLDGLVMIWGTPFPLAVPASRRQVEEEGKTAWFYFEKVHPSENVTAWIEGGPALKGLNEADRLPEATRRSVEGNLARTPACLIELNTNTVIVCQMGNVAWRSGRKVHWDGCRFAGDADANALIARCYRAPYRLPA